jgi:Leucine-rich repeat (LRR) protein
MPTFTHTQSLSSPLWQLTGLRSLDLSGNYCRALSGAISSLSRLSYLNLSSNVMDDLPDTMAQLTGLQVSGSPLLFVHLCTSLK